MPRLPSRWFLVGVEAVTPKRKIVLTNYYASVPLLGTAVDLALKAPGLRHAVPIYADIVEGPAEGSEELVRRKLYRETVDSRPLKQGRGFVDPHGVLIGAIQPDDAMLDSFGEGFAVLEGPEDGWTVHAMLHRDRLPTVWRRVAATFVQVDALIVQVLDHFDNHLEIADGALSANVREVWTKDVDLAPADFAPLFDSIETDILHNGHLDFAIHSTPTETTLWLTEHKTIRLVTANATVRDRVAECLAEDVPEFEHVLSFEDNGCSHYHYRPHGSRDRKQLAKWMRSTGWARDGS